jgi:YfiH family protein
VSFYLTPKGSYRSSLLDSHPWLDHCFGTIVDGPPDSCRTLRQIHSDRVLALHECGADSEADALVTSEPDRWIGVKTADCVPILLADPEHHVAAAVHAGWRGTAANIAAAVVARLARDFGSRPEALVAGIGPAIGACCYEVGPEVVCQFASIFPEWDDLSHPKRLNLAEANRRLLVRAGVPANRVDTASLCTACSPDQFHSWRRDRRTDARMVSAICIR